MKGEIKPCGCLNQPCSHRTAAPPPRPGSQVARSSEEPLPEEDCDLCGFPAPRDHDRWFGPVKCSKCRRVYSELPEESVQAIKDEFDAGTPARIRYLLSLGTAHEWMKPPEERETSEPVGASSASRADEGEVTCAECGGSLPAGSPWHVCAECWCRYVDALPNP